MPSVNFILDSSRRYFDAQTTYVRNDINLYQALHCLNIAIGVILSDIKQQILDTQRMKISLSNNVHLRDVTRRQYTTLKADYMSKNNIKLDNDQGNVVEKCNKLSKWRTPRTGSELDAWAIPA